MFNAKFKPHIFLRANSNRQRVASSWHKRSYYDKSIYWSKTNETITMNQILSNNTYWSLIQFQVVAKSTPTAFAMKWINKRGSHTLSTTGGEKRIATLIRKLTPPFSTTLVYKSSDPLPRIFTICPRLREFKQSDYPPWRDRRGADKPCQHRATATPASPQRSICQ